MTSRGAFLVGLLLLMLGALWFRLPALGVRQMHGDEAVHAFKFRDVWEKGRYHYDANEYHGPTIYYAALPSAWLRGRHTFADMSAADYRLPIAVFGAGLLFLLAPLAGGLGRRATLWAALFTAISPAFVYYSRDFIQETLLAFFTLGMIACGWQYARTRHPAWLLTASVSAGLMIASKETAVLTFVSLGLALPLTVWWTRRVDKRTLDLRPLWNRKLFLLAVVLALFVACLFVSGFFTNLVGPLDYLRSYTPWLRRAHGTDLHKHPWHYYLHVLFWTRVDKGPLWSEGVIGLLALVGIVAALLPRAQNRLEGNVSLARYLACYTVLLTFIYSVIPYKTPWCVLSFLQGMILLAGVGAMALLRIAPGRPLKAILVVLILLATFQLGRQAYRGSYVAYGAPDNPYVYAQPVPDVENLQKKVEDVARVSPQGTDTVIQLISVDNYYWPVPWYLRRFPNIGFYNAVPPDANAPFILASPQFDEELTKKLDPTHISVAYFGVRPGVFLELWVRMDLWTKYVEDKKAREKASGQSDE